MGWGEALRLARELYSETDSHIHAAIASWNRPTSREALVLMDVFDSLEAARIGRKAKQYPRPWEKKAHRIGAGTRMTIPQLRLVLDEQRNKTEEASDD